MRTILLILGATLLFFPADRVSAETIGYSYDAAGRLIRADYPDGSIEYVYDPAGNLLSRIVTAGLSPLPIEPTMATAKGGAGLQITYSTETCSSADHALFVGSLVDFGIVSNAVCSVGKTGNVTIPLPAESVWFLVAGVVNDRFSSVGSDASGERVLTGVEGVCPGLSADTSRSCP